MATGHPPRRSGVARHDDVDLVTLGRRIRHARRARGLTLAQVAEAVGTVPSVLSLVENGRREAKIGMLASLAEALGVPLAELLERGAPSRRAALEIGVEHARRGPVFAALQMPALRIGAGVPSEWLEAVLRLHGEIERRDALRAATPEEARRANASLRATMRERDNHLEHLEEVAAQLLAAIGYSSGPLAQSQVEAIAAHLGLTLYRVDDLPESTRSITDGDRGRIYLHRLPTGARDPRSVVLQAIAAHVLEHPTPPDYAAYLRQRVEANYLAAALLMPHGETVARLRAAKAGRELSLDDLRDHFQVTYEIAAHRFTNLASSAIAVPVHFLKVHAAGAIHKAYENDGFALPSDPLGAVEGQFACRFWAARQALGRGDRLATLFQITDTPQGTFWETARVHRSRDGSDYAIAMGVPFEYSGYFAGRETSVRQLSRCPGAECCRLPPPSLVARWGHAVRPAARPHASLLAALPTGAYPGVDMTEVYSFLERHAVGGADEVGP